MLHAWLQGKARRKVSGGNAHVDVVAPYIPPKFKDGIVSGRGACDDKGPVRVWLARSRCYPESCPAHGLEWNQNVLGMFVVEEETGGNGSLSLAMDRELKRFYDSIVVYECAGMKLHPANREGCLVPVGVSSARRGIGF